MNLLFGIKNDPSYEKSPNCIPDLFLENLFKIFRGKAEEKSAWIF